MAQVLSLVLVAEILLHFLLAPAAELGRPTATAPAAETELYRTMAPIPDLKPRHQRDHVAPDRGGPLLSLVQLVSGRRRRLLKGSPPSAAQTGHAVFPHPAFMNGLSRSEARVLVRQG